MTNIKMQIPDILTPYQDRINATIKPFVKVKTSAAETLTVWQSKFGGEPYFPKDMPYPMNADQEPLKLLAQINFSEVPSLQDFPSSGILQFYIARDDLYGLNFDDPRLQDTFRIIYFEQVITDKSQLLTDFSFVDVDENDEYLSPLQGQYALLFEQAIEVIPTEDFAFDQAIVRDSQVAWNDGLWELYSETFSSAGHKLGGYPYFTQSDPREYNDELKDYILLFQMDTEYADGIDIMWGDSGVGNFFIHPDDLKNKDFSKVLYNWDCC